jgi:putative phosphoribosyl transferase
MRRRVVFANRAEAGRLLGEALLAMRLERPVVLALPRGGVPVGAEIAGALRAPLDVVFAHKIGAPDQPELAVGAIADGDEPEMVLNDQLVHALELDEAYIAAAAKRELAALERRRLQYRHVRPAVELAGRAAILVDDGIATGMTMQAALRCARRAGPARLIAAVPVASREAAAMLKREADAVVCLASPRRFASVGSFYRSFGQVSDEEVAALLGSAVVRA